MSCRNFVLVILSVFLVSSCSDESNGVNNCEFVGKWCTGSPISPGSCLFGVDLEIREDGQVFQVGVSDFTWEETNCETLSLKHKNSDATLEWTIIAVDEDNLTIDLGVGPITYIDAD